MEPNQATDASIHDDAEMGSQAQPQSSLNYAVDIEHVAVVDDPRKWSDSRKV